MSSLNGSRNELQHHLDRHCNSVEASRRYSQLDGVFSTSFLCSGATNVMSKKVKAGKLVSFDADLDEVNLKQKQLPFTYVYTRRRKKHPEDACNTNLSFFDVLLERVEPKLHSPASSWSAEKCDKGTKKRRKLNENEEFVKLRVQSSPIEKLGRSKHPENRRNFVANRHPNAAGTHLSSNVKKLDLPKQSARDSKRWFRLKVNDVDPHLLIGLPCKVYWPLDAEWYSGRIIRFNSDTDKHQIEYDDGDQEDIVLANEKVKFLISPNSMAKLNLSVQVKDFNGEDYDYDEMVVLAASLDDCEDFEPGDIVWAKLTGYAMWPAVVVDESLLRERKGLKKSSSGGSVLVQFFATHDFARVKPKQIISFLKGLLSSFHLKCKKSLFTRSLEEAKLYLSKQKLPKRMMRLRDDLKDGACESRSGESEGNTESDEDYLEVRRIRRVLDGLATSPYVIGDLQILSLGKIVKDSEYFQDDRFIWPEGYTALRKFASASDPSVCTTYKMEVLRDQKSKIRPLFQVTLNNGEQIKGQSPSACWKNIYKRIRMSHGNDEALTLQNQEPFFRSGAEMFGFSNPEVIKLIKGMSKSNVLTKVPCKVASHQYQNLPIGYRPVRVKWKDLDKCNVCHMDEEYENNLFLQCDKCRMMVHAKCYGELEPINGILWFCNLCCPNAPDPTPPCCLCPVVGGAMKPTTDGRWAHLACAIWIPETCLSDVKKMEPIDGIKRISRDRWKLLCTICGVAYGACIQCSSNGCRAAFHPLCARAAGLCLELENEERIHLLSIEDDDSRSIRFLSFCKRHRRRSQNRLFPDSRVCRITPTCSDFIPPPNPSGCARTEPYNYLGRRGLKEPAALAAASSKRLYVENQPYLVSGFSQHTLFGRALPFSGNLQKLKGSQLDAPNDILSMPEKYSFMRHTVRKRLAFGKSSIHGFGIFAKHPHRAGDMVIEYVGELVRPPIADRRERLIYNSLVGAGTYMFRIDDERVIDATRAGSIAHLINHSCEPNCYSRVISVNGDEHIIIFAKRDIKRWEELTYDYRFFSIDEELACYCGFPRCRGIVNDIETEERLAKAYAPMNELLAMNPCIGNL